MMKLYAVPGWAGLNAKAWSFHCEQAVYGKANSAESDYRWLAKSPAFKGVETYRTLSVGQPDQPNTFSAWRPSSLDGELVYHAVSYYPSQATDHFGRSGSLERRVLEWKPERKSDTPASLAALALLSEVSTIPAIAGIATVPTAKWRDPNYFLPIDPWKFQATEGQMEKILQSGQDWIAKNISLKALATFYTALSSNTPKPVVLPAAEPVTANALAALLAFFANSSKDETPSICGWIPTASEPQLPSLAHWDAIVSRRTTAAPPNIEALQAARNLAFSLRNGRPAHQDVQILLRFAEGEARWLPPPTVENSFNSDECDLLTAAAMKISAQVKEMPQYLRSARKEVKESYTRHLRQKYQVFCAFGRLMDSSWEPPEVALLPEIKAVWTYWSPSSPLARQKLAAIN